MNPWCGMKRWSLCLYLVTGGSGYPSRYSNQFHARQYSARNSSRWRHSLVNRKRSNSIFMSIQTLSSFRNYNHARYYGGASLKSGRF